MNFKDIPDGLSFDDVLLLPQHSYVFKDDVSLSAKLTKKITLKIPFVSSPMDTVTESALAITLARLGGIGIIHRNFSIAGEADEVALVKKEKLLVGAAVGVGTDLYPRIDALLKAGVNVIVLDSAHGHAEYIVKATKEIKTKYPELDLISGNVATAEGFENLARAGASAVRVGVGPGSICTTRIVTGVGMPQISAIADCAPISRKYGVSLIADGGLKQSGDIVKALAAGGWCVMIGSMFAAVKESPGKLVEIDGKKYKQYRAMGSVAAMKKGSASRYGQGMESKKMIAEGVEGLVPYKGTLQDYLFQLIGGLKTGMEYIGAGKIEDMWGKGKFVRISHAGLIESHPHNIIITNKGESYQ